MNDFIFALKIIFPILFYILLGYSLKRRIFSSPERIAGANKLCSEILLPCTLFYSTAKANFSNPAGQVLARYCSILTLVGIILICIAVPLLIKDKPSAKSVIQGSFRGNLMVISMAMIANMYGEAGSIVGGVAVAVVVAIYNVVAVFVLSDFSGTFHPRKLLQVLRSALCCPLLIGAVLGLLFAISGVRMPPVMDQIVSKLATSGSCLSVLILGAQFTFKRAVRNIRLSGIAVVIKVVLFPLISVLVALMLGFRGMELACIFSIMGAPTSTNSAAIAESLGCNGQLSGEIVVLSTFCFLATFFFGILALRWLRLI